MSFIVGFTERYLENKDRDRQEKLLREQLNVKRQETLLSLRAKHGARLSEQATQTHALGALRGRLTDEEGNWVPGGEEYFNRVSETGAANQIMGNIAEIESDDESHEMYIAGDTLMNSFNFHGDTGGGQPSFNLPSMEDILQADLGDDETYLRQLSDLSVAPPGKQEAFVDIDRRELVPGGSKVRGEVYNELDRTLAAALTPTIEPGNTNAENSALITHVNNLGSTDIVKRERARSALLRTPEGLSAYRRMVNMRDEIPTYGQLMVAPEFAQLNQIISFIDGWDTLDPDVQEALLIKHPQIGPLVQ